MRRVDINDQPLSSFLTDDLWYLDSHGEKYIIDRITGVKFPIEKFVYSRPNGQINRKANQPFLLESLRQSQQIFLIGPSTDTVLALAANFRVHSEWNFVFDRFDLPNFDTEQFL
jgi:hypothetical protein